MSKLVTFEEIYNAYPESDLLGVGPPSEYDSTKEERSYLDLAKAESGDTLYVFVLAEAQDMEGDRAEVVRALRRAVDDLEAVIARLEENDD